MIEVYYAEDDETIGKSVKEYLEQQNCKVAVFDFAVSYAFKSSGTGQSFAETADAGEHIDEFNQAPGSLWTWVLFWAYLIGTPHQKQKQPVTGCTEQDFFTVHNV